jgi:hypothetical protein
MAYTFSLIKEKKYDDLYESLENLENFLENVTEKKEKQEEKERASNEEAKKIKEALEKAKKQKKKNFIKPNKIKELKKEENTLYYYLNKKNRKLFKYKNPYLENFILDGDTFKNNENNRKYVINSDNSLTLFIDDNEFLIISEDDIKLANLMIGLVPILTNIKNDDIINSTLVNENEFSYEIEKNYTEEFLIIKNKTHTYCSYRPVISKKPLPKFISKKGNSVNKEFLELFRILTVKNYEKIIIEIKAKIKNFNIEQLKTLISDIYDNLNGTNFELIAKLYLMFVNELKYPLENLRKDIIDKYNKFFKNYCDTNTHSSTNLINTAAQINLIIKLFEKNILINEDIYSILDKLVNDNNDCNFVAIKNLLSNIEKNKFGKNYFDKIYDKLKNLKLNNINTKNQFEIEDILKGAGEKNSTLFKLQYYEFRDTWINVTNNQEIVFTNNKSNIYNKTLSRVIKKNHNLDKESITYLYLFVINLFMKAVDTKKIKNLTSVEYIFNQIDKFSTVNENSKIVTFDWKRFGSNFHSPFISIEKIINEKKDEFLDDDENIPILLKDIKIEYYPKPTKKNKKFLSYQDIVTPLKKGKLHKKRQAWNFQTIGLENNKIQEYGYKDKKNILFGKLKEYKELLNIT